MSMDLHIIQDKVDKAIDLKNNMRETFSYMKEYEIDRMVMMAIYYDAFTSGIKKAKLEVNREGYTPRDMKIFAKFAKDYKSSPCVGKAFDKFIAEYHEIIKKYSHGVK